MSTFRTIGMPCRVPRNSTTWRSLSRDSALLNNIYLETIDIVAFKWGPWRSSFSIWDRHCSTKWTVVDVPPERRCCIWDAEAARSMAVLELWEMIILGGSDFLIDDDEWWCMILNIMRILERVEGIRKSKRAMWTGLRSIFLQLTACCFEDRASFSILLGMANAILPSCSV